MATSGSTSVSVTAYDTLKFNWVQLGQSTVNNYTTINWSLQLVSGSAGQIISSATKSWSVTVNGTSYSGKNSVAVGNNTTITLAAGETTIPHNSDGTKSFNYSFSQDFSITFAGNLIGTKTGSGVGILNAIPRATTPTLSATSVDMGSEVTITLPRASTSFTHDLAYSFAGGNYVSIGPGVDTSAKWTVPITLAESIPNATSGTVTIKCVTKNGSAEIGTKTVLLTVKVPTSIVPTISDVLLADADNGLTTTYGAYIQSKSKITASVIASGVYNSTIKSYSTKFLGKTYTSKTFTTDTVQSSGSLSMVTTVTDSRGRSASKTTPISVVSYKPPEVSTFRVSRYNSSGAADPNGTYVWLDLAYAVTSLNSKNTAEALIQYKTSTESSWKTLYTRKELSYNSTLKPTSQTFSTDYQWDFRVQLTDAFNSANPVIYTTFIPSGKVILDIKADGEGIAFFKTSTKKGVDIAGALPDSPISLTTNADLNTLTTPGFYVIPSSTVSGTVTNKPYTDTATASIKVERTGDGMLKQILQKSTKDNGAIYERGYTSSSWGSWSVVYAGAGKVLWSGNYVMNGTQSVTLSENVSQQQHGIVLVFSRYATSGEQNYAYSCHFISKVFVSTVNNSANINLIMATTKMDYVAGKTLTVTDTSIAGHADNIVTGTTSGITYNNDKFALRYVIGV